MTTNSGDSPITVLSPEEREWLEKIQQTESLEALSRLMDSDSEHRAYFSSKEKWATLKERQLATEPSQAGLPGRSVTVDGRKFTVHGVTHADTDAEQEFLHKHVSHYLDEGAQVFCEQGIRAMYFDTFSDVFEMDDYRWAMHHSKHSGIDSHVEGLLEPDFDELTNNIKSLMSQLRTVTFSLIKSGSDVYGDNFASALGDVASDFLVGHEEIGTAEDFQAFKKTRRAARDPEQLEELQHYYEKSFLPQPLEREWLRRHDREIELFTHGRNERIADFAVFNANTDRVHLIVGAAHQPGTVYYLNEYREGDRTTADFEVIE